MINREISGYIERKTKNYVTLVHMRSETDMVARPFTHLSLLFAPPLYYSFMPFRVASDWSALWSHDHMITNKLRGIHHILPTLRAWNPKDKLLFSLKTKI